MIQQAEKLKINLPKLFLFTGIIFVLTSFLKVSIPGINIHDTYYVIAVFGATFIFLLLYLLFALIYHLFKTHLNNKIGFAQYVVLTIAIITFRFSNLLESDNSLICLENSLTAKIQCNLHFLIIVLFGVGIIIFIYNILFSIFQRIIKRIKFGKQ